MDLRSKKDLELLLERVPVFKRPILELEQYVTNADVVAHIVWLSHISGELKGSAVADFGCGTGRFAIAAALLNARDVYCIDIDYNALEIARRACCELSLYNRIHFVLADVTRIEFNRRFDVVFQNPPFGIQSRRGIDIEFLRKAVEYSNIVYSIHKYETIDYVIKKVNEWGRQAKLVHSAEIVIRLMYSHHRKLRHRVRVGVIKVF